MTHPSSPDDRDHRRGTRRRDVRLRTRCQCVGLHAAPTEKVSGAPLNAETAVAIATRVIAEADAARAETGAAGTRGPRGRVGRLRPGDGRGRRVEQGQDRRS